MAKKYKCPYCNFSSERNELIDHISNNHEDLIPEGYTPTRVVFNVVNKREFGVCMICKGKTDWNEKVGKYDKICHRESCRKAAREAFTKNMIKVYNKPTLLGDEAWQAHMLANRKISGKYKFVTDGGSHTYTGTYEKKCLEFMDTVLNIPSTDIMCPGPTFEYEYLGEKHKWITDIYYIPANLVIEIKDGGDNPNNRTMTSYREKQIEKEKMITNMGVYNYIRLTNNQFVQLIDILAELKEQAMNGEISPISRIHEAMGIAAMGGIAGAAEPIYVGLYKRCTFADSKDYDSMCLTKGMFEDDTLGIEDGILKNIKLDENTSVALFKFVGNRENYKKLLECYNKECSDVDIYEILSGKKMLSKDQIAYDKDFEFVDFAMPIIDIGGEK